jgi:hypothetical protein
MKTGAVNLVGMGRLADWACASHAGFELQAVGDIAVVLAVRTAENAPSHYHHVLAACRRGPFLPARAGQIWNPEGEATIGAKAMQDALHAQLELVSGSIEVTLEMSLEGPPEVLFVNALGASYLRHRQSELAASSEVEARLTRTADLITRSVRYRTRSIRQHATPAGERKGLLMAFLVERSEGHRLANDVEVLAGAALPDAEVRVDGPWPPYHFAALDLVSGREARAA